MKKVNFLSLLSLAFGLAIITSTTAFAPKSSATLYYSPSSTGYRDVTSIVMGENYQCNENNQIECLVQFSNDNPQTGVKTVISQGEFVQLP